MIIASAIIVGDKKALLQRGLLPGLCDMNDAAFFVLTLIGRVMSEALRTLVMALEVGRRGHLCSTCGSRTFAP
ncbi:MAG: hypothetical protein CVU60_07310 [Deltaproteobacteria bacterium HGW-Deltaproteobacteria-18]|nr:MAG: hypothetical protein CVU60_07310 [Deltaproteobacteria bacterium HGW-Deltaproteobacteria-18]